MSDSEKAIEVIRDAIRESPMCELLGDPEPNPLRSKGYDDDRDTERQWVSGILTPGQVTSALYIKASNFVGNGNRVDIGLLFTADRTKVYVLDYFCDIGFKYKYKEWFEAITGDNKKETLYTTLRGEYRSYVDVANEPDRLMNIFRELAEIEEYITLVTDTTKQSLIHRGGSVDPGKTELALAYPDVRDVPRLTYACRYCGESVMLDTDRVQFTNFLWDPSCDACRRNVCSNCNGIVDRDAAVLLRHLIDIDKGKEFPFTCKGCYPDSECCTCGDSYSAVEQPDFIKSNLCHNCLKEAVRVYKEVYNL